MNNGFLFLDMAPLGGGLAIFGGVAFLLGLAAVALVAFFLLRKTLKMGFRLTIVGVILAIAIAGCVSFWWLGSSRPKRPDVSRPTPVRPK